MSGYVQAIDPKKYTVYWNPNDKATQDAINSSFGSGVDGGPDGLDKTVLMTTGTRIGSQKLGLDRWWSDKYDSATYAREVYCTISEDGVSLSAQAPDSNKLYLRYRYAVVVRVDPRNSPKETRPNSNRVAIPFTERASFETLVGFINKNNGDRSEPTLHIPSLPADPNNGRTRSTTAVAVPLDSKDEYVANGNNERGNWVNSNGTNTRHIFRRADIDLRADEWDDNYDASKGEASFYYFMEGMGWEGSTDQKRENLQKRLNDCMPTTKGPADLTSNYWKLSEQDRLAWNRTQSTTGALPTASLEDSETPDRPSCESNGGSKLGWIICPIIELGSNMTDFVFRDFIVPFMENVPISSDPEDKGYKAWSQFRLLGNIILIGTLLAIVYSQARGGDR